MPRQRDSKKAKNKRIDISDSESSDDELIHFFVPGERINSDVLSFFLFSFIDQAPQISPSQHPVDRNRTGFNVAAHKALNSINLRDIINDTRDWETEQNARSFKQQPYQYHKSLTARRRINAGPSKPQETAQQQSQQIQPKASSPPLSNPISAAAYGQFPHQQPQLQPPSEYSRISGNYHPASSKPETTSSTYNIYNTSVNTTQYTANVPGASHLVGTTGTYLKPYPSTNYPQINKPGYETTPSYGGSNPRGPPRNPPPPGQPDPDAFDEEMTGSTSPGVENPSQRQGSLVPGEDQSNRAYAGTNRGGESYSTRNPRQSPYDDPRRAGHRG